MARSETRPEDQLLDQGLDRSFNPLGGRSLFTGSSVAMNHATESGGAFSIWSRGAETSFQGRESELSLNGSVPDDDGGRGLREGPAGDRRLPGSQPRVRGVRRRFAWFMGSGGPGLPLPLWPSGHASTAVTGLYPWIGYRLNERLSAG